MAKLKIRPEHVKALREAIKPLASVELFQEYRKRDLTHRRYRWDLVWKSGFNVCDLIYPYANDTHLDSALRFLVLEDGSILGEEK